MIHIALLGPIEVRRAGRIVRGFESRKAVALLGYLALTAHPHRREHLADLLWGDLSESRGRGNLSRVLHNLSHLLPGVWSADRWTIAIEVGPRCSVDAAHFRKLAALAEPRAWIDALRLVRGELMADLALEACPEFARWLSAERLAWHERVSAAMHSLVEHLRSEGRRDDALAWATRLVRLDPGREEAQRALMVLLAETGRRAAALAQFERSRQELADELDVAPSAETLALVERIRRGEIPVVGSAPARASAAGNLPAALTSFVGRAVEIDRAMERLDDPDCRLLTMVGPGGAGKSRLALEVARGASDRYRDGAWLVRLAGVRRPEGVPAAIAAAIGCALEGPDEPLGQLLRYLETRHALLILDDLEHLLPAADHVLDILRRASRVTVIATSRDRLGLQSEWLLPVAGLSLPEGDGPSPAAAIESDAVALFVARARQAVPGFGADPASLRDIAAICRLLEGLPLAIELAAAQTAATDTDSILRTVRTNLGSVAVALRDVPERHQSLRAVFDHSWQLLDPAERESLARLAVFRGGFDLAGASAVAGAGADMLASLERHSLIQRVPGNRWQLHEQVRQVAFGRLGGAAAEADAQARHADHHLALVESAAPQLAGPDQGEWLSRLVLEHDNLASALDWLERTALHDAMRLAASLWRVWLYRGDWREGLARTESILEAATGQPPSREHALVHNVAGILASIGGERHRARARFESALAMWRALALERDTANTLNNLGILADEAGDEAAALAYHQESLAIRRRLEQAHDVAVSLNNIAVLLTRRGSPDQAREMLDESLAIKRALGDTRGIAMSLANLGDAAATSGDAQAAFGYLHEGIRLCWELDDLPDLAEQLSQTVRACVVAGLHDPALRIAGAQEALRERLGAAMAPADRPAYDAAIASARSQLSPDQAKTAFSEGYALTADEVVAFALDVSGRS